MLLYLEIKNFQSFLDVNFSFLASNSLTNHLDHIYKINNNFSALKYALILGSNGSGKSTINNALKSLIDILINKKIKEKQKDNFNYTQSENKKKYSSFRVFFNKLDKIYEYILTLNFDSQLIINETLNEVSDDIKNIFINKNNGIKLSEYNDLYSELTNNILSLSYRYNVVNSDLTKDINLITLENYLKRYYEIDKLKLSDSSIEELLSYLPSVYHNLLDNKNLINKTLVLNLGERVFFYINNVVKEVLVKPKDLAFYLRLKDMSDGFRRLFSICLTYFMMDNKVIFIDEIDKSLHYLITKKLINDLINFNIDKCNQLLISAHFLALLKEDIFRNDEIYFVNKFKGNSKVNSLIEYKTSKDIYNNYLLGRYGAIPKL